MRCDVDAKSPAPARQRVERVIESIGHVAVAVSGGVDSMTLAVIAHRLADTRTTIYHAVSRAVPVSATERVERYAQREGWRLKRIDAGEFVDMRYVANPVNRCYFCKMNLYVTIAPLTDAVIIAGTNTDDLGDFRPGLTAAAEHGVRHPYVESGVDKSVVRAIAARLGLDDLCELPAAPCLSSRVETGIAIDPDVLQVVDACERLVRDATGATTVRCRVRRNAVVIELDGAALSGFGVLRRVGLAEEVRARMATVGVSSTVRFERYRMGSAFLRQAGDV